MGSRLKTYSFLRLSLFVSLTGFVAGEASSKEENRYLDAVREFADNVLKYGKDLYGEKHTPLFVDGLNIHTHEPVKWIAPSGESWILSNLASQQNLFRTLDGLTKITGDPKYRQAAVEAIKYAFANLRSSNGLLHWGGHAAYDAGADKPCGRGQHELKGFYPYYQLMWEVNPQATRQFIEAFWSADVWDWSNLAMDRHGHMTQPLGKAWNHEYKGGPVFFKSGAGTSPNAAGDLVHAAAWLTKLSKDKEPLLWAKRLAYRFVETRHPKTGISYPSFTTRSGRMRERESNDDVIKKLVPPTVEFPWHELTNPIARQCCFGYFMPTPGIPVSRQVSLWQNQLQLGEMSGSEGDALRQWALEELTAFGKVSYRRKDNVYVPMLTDGTSLEGYVVKEDGPLGPKGVTLELIPASPPYFWTYTLAYRVTKDEFMWEMAHSMAKGNEFGDIGATPKGRPQLKISTDCPNPYAILAFLALHRETGKNGFLEMGKRIGDNILRTRFHKGFFAASKKHIYTKFDAIDSLALLHLHSALVGETAAIPQVWPSTPFFDMPYREKEQVIDNQIIYTLTESAEPPKSLQEAAAVGDVDLIKSLIEKGAVVDAREDSFYKTALHRAAISGQKEAAELLLAEGADVEAGTYSVAATALHYAVEKGHKEVAELLVAKGADVNVKDTLGDTPLHYSARSRSSRRDVVELLIAKGADVNARNNNGETALDLAVRRSRTEVVDLLVEKGAEVSTIHLAASIGNVAKVISFLEKGTEVDAKNSAGATPLYSAVSGGHTDVAKLLMEKGADVNFGKEWGWPLLHDAANSGHKEIAELLLTNGADVNVKDKSGYSPLHYALWNSDEDMTKLLINKGADWKAKDSSGYTTLHWAVMMGSEELTKFLLTKGADVNAKSNDGETPLDVAAYGSPRGVGELLVEKGAEVSTLHTAAYVGDQAKVKGFIEEGADINGQNANGGTPLHAAAAGGRRDVLEFLIDKGADIKAKDKRDMTPLHTAARAGQRDAAELLLSNGADVNSKSRGGLTALHYAAMWSHRDVTELLLAKGADVNAGTGVGVTPLHSATTAGSKEVVELLIAKGANVNATDRMGRSALSRAKEGEHDEIVELLRKRGTDEERQAVLSPSSAKPKKQPVADKVFTGEAVGDEFGGYIDLGKDVNGDRHNDIVIGAPRHGSNRGRAYLFYGGPSMDAKPDKVFDGEEIGDHFGVGVRLGQINGDEYADVIVGGPCFDSDRGRVYVFDGGPEMDACPDTILEGEDPRSWFGFWSCVGDLNADKRTDLLVGALQYDQFRGRLYLFSGASDGGLTTPAIKKFSGENCGDRFGRQFAMGDDVNGDGFPDLVVGAEYWCNDKWQGRAYLYHGGPNMDAKPDMIFTGEVPVGRNRFGNAVELGDIDDDGFTDVLIGAPFFNRSQGRAYLFFGGPDMDNVADRIFDPEPPNRPAHWGDSIACGDMNKDGHKDIAIGGSRHGDYRGQAAVYCGGPGRSMDLIPDKLVEGEMSACYFGNQVRLADVNSDGFDDLLVGDWMYNSNQGRVYLYYGGPDK